MIMRMMKNNNNETVMVIGIDHGYGNMKTATRCFPSGVARYDKEPIFQNNLLFYNGMYYQIGEEHKEFCAEKTQDEDGAMVITQNPTLAPVSGDYIFTELENPVFTKDGDNIKVSVSVKYLDNKSKMTQISQYELVLHKDDNYLSPTQYSKLEKRIDTVHLKLL